MEAFAREYSTVTRGKGARTPFRQRPWQPDILGRLSARGPRPRQGLISMPRGNGNQRLKEPSSPQQLLRLEERAEGVVPAVVRPRTVRRPPWSEPATTSRTAWTADGSRSVDSTSNQNVGSTAVSRSSATTFPELLPDVLTGTVQSAGVRPRARVRGADGYEAMDKRHAIKVLVRPWSRDARALRTSTKTSRAIARKVTGQFLPVPDRLRVARLELR